MSTAVQNGHVQAGVGGQHPGSAGVRHDGNAAACGHRLASQQGRGVEEFPDVTCRDDARLREQCLAGDQGRGRRCGVGRGGALSGLRASRMHGEHRHMGADVAGRAAELARVAEGLQVQHGELGGGILIPPGEEVGPGHIGLVAQRRERGNVDARP